jgi:hypothetical protein
MAQQVFIVQDHRRRQVAGSRGRQKVIHKGSKKGNSTGREKGGQVRSGHPGGQAIGP